MNVIKIIGRADDAPSEYDDRYVMHYDPTIHAPDGSYSGGQLVATANKRRAKLYKTAGEAMEEWRRTPECECHATRPWDGKPNRPMSAFTVTVEPFGLELQPAVLVANLVFQLDLQPGSKTGTTIMSRVLLYLKERKQYDQNRAKFGSTIREEPSA